MAKKDRMKNGLDMLFEDNYNEESSNEGITSVRISLIEPDKNQPRNNFDDEKLRELAENISRHGVLQPVLVRPLEDGSYMLVAGERRWRAARLAGLNEIPVVIKELDDFEAAQISLIENLQREDLDPIEEAMAYRRLMDEYGMTQEQLSKSVGRSRAAIANSVRMLKLPEDIQKLISDREITPGHAKVLCGIDDEETLMRMTICAKDGCSVRELEQKLNSDSEPVQLYKKKRKHSGGYADYSEPFKKYSLETALSFKQLYGLNASLGIEKDGMYSLKFSFDSEEQLKEMISELSDKL